MTLFNGKPPISKPIVLNSRKAVINGDIKLICDARYSLTQMDFAPSIGDIFYVTQRVSRFKKTFYSLWTKDHEEQKHKFPEYENARKLLVNIVDPKSNTIISPIDISKIFEDVVEEIIKDGDNVLMELEINDGILYPTSNLFNTDEESTIWKCSEPEENDWYIVQINGERDPRRWNTHNKFWASFDGKTHTNDEIDCWADHTIDDKN